jgi:hypothetical protein
MWSPYTILESATNFDKDRLPRLSYLVEQAVQYGLGLDGFEQDRDVGVKRADHRWDRCRRMDHEWHPALGQHMGEGRDIAIAELAIDDRRGYVMLLEQLQRLGHR